MDRDEALANWQSAFMHYGKDHEITKGWEKYYAALTNRGNELPEVTVTSERPVDMWKHFKTSATDYVKEDPLQAVLDAAGFIPGVDVFSDLGLTMYDLYNGDYTGAGISALAAIIPGMSASMGKKIGKAAKEAGSKVVKAADNVGSGVSELLNKLKRYYKIDKSPEAKALAEKINKSDFNLKDYVDTAIDESVYVDPNFEQLDAFKIFNYDFRKGNYRLGGHGSLSPANVKSKYIWEYGDEFKDFKEALKNLRGIRSNNDGTSLTNIGERFRYIDPEDTSDIIQSAHHSRDVGAPRIIVESPSGSTIDMFNTGNARAAHDRYHQLIKNNLYLSHKLDNTKTQVRHTTREGGFSGKEDAFGIEGPTYSFGLELLMLIYNYLRHSLKRPVIPDDFDTFMSHINISDIRNLANSTHGGRYVLKEAEEHMNSGLGLRNLIGLYSVPAAVGTSAYLHSQSLNKPNSYKLGGQIKRRIKL